MTFAEWIWTPFPVITIALLILFAAFYRLDRMEEEEVRRADVEDRRAQRRARIAAERSVYRRTIFDRPVQRGDR